MTPPAPFPLPFRPQRVLLFSGHMVDAPGRAIPRFPLDRQAAAASRIAQVLEDLGADARDIGLTQGAAGGDLLFAEACVRRAVPVQLLLPLPEPTFIETSILPCDGAAAWKQRYLALKAALPQPPATMPAVPDDPFEACNLWLLGTAVAAGAQALHLICLWNGEGGDGPGGTAHMVREVQWHGGRVHWIDSRTL